MRQVLKIILYLCILIIHVFIVTWRKTHKHPLSQDTNLVAWDLDTNAGVGNDGCCMSPPILKV